MPAAPVLWSPATGTSRCTTCSARAGLAELLDAVATSAEVGASKPSGELFAAALALAGVDAWQAVHVGDSWGEDVEGARAAGIDAVWLRRRPHDGAAPPAAGVRVIETLEDF